MKRNCQLSKNKTLNPKTSKNITSMEIKTLTINQISSIHQRMQIKLQRQLLECQKKIRHTKIILVLQTCDDNKYQDSYNLLIQQEINTILPKLKLTMKILPHQK